MAAFSEQHPSFVLNSFLVPNTSNNMSSLTEETTITTETCFSSMLPNHEYLEEIPLHAQIHVTSPLHKSCSPRIPLSCPPTSITDPSFTVIQDSVSSAMGVELVNGDQVTDQVVSPGEKKRKTMEMKVERESESTEKRRQYNTGNSRNSKKKMKKVAEEPPTGYVHVRARRGQATDSHSLAERVRRQKISVRMKLLQSLVPGCDKMTGKALILDEIIKYVQTLQTQVEYLAAKLASLNPLFDDCELDFSTNTLAQGKACISDFQLPPIIESNSTQLTSFPDQKITTLNSQMLLHHEQRSNMSFPGNGNLLWGTDSSQRHGLANYYGLHSWSAY